MSSSQQGWSQTFWFIGISRLHHLDLGGEMEISGFGWHRCNSVEILAGKDIHPSGKDIHLCIQTWYIEKKYVFFLRYRHLYMFVFSKCCIPSQAILMTGAMFFEVQETLKKNLRHLELTHWLVQNTTTSSNPEIIRSLGLKPTNPPTNPFRWYFFRQH